MQDQAVIPTLTVKLSRWSGAYAASAIHPRGAHQLCGGSSPKQALRNFADIVDEAGFALHSIPAPSASGNAYPQIGIIITQPKLARYHATFDLGTGVLTAEGHSLRSVIERVAGVIELVNYDLPICRHPAGCVVGSGTRRTCLACMTGVPVFEPEPSDREAGTSDGSACSAATPDQTGD